MQRAGDAAGRPRADAARDGRGAAAGRSPAAGRAPEWTRCDACGTGMQSLGHCKWLCRRCGFLRTCIDTV